TTLEQTTPKGLDARVLNEGYGTGAWHGPDLKAELGDVTPELAFWRPARGRHNIAEIALHHAFCARSKQIPPARPKLSVLFRVSKFSSKGTLLSSWGRSRGLHTPARPRWLAPRAAVASRVVLPQMCAAILRLSLRASAFVGSPSVDSAALLLERSVFQCAGLCLWD